MKWLIVWYDNDLILNRPLEFAFIEHGWEPFCITDDRIYFRKKIEE